MQSFDVGCSDSSSRILFIRSKSSEMGSTFSRFNIAASTGTSTNKLSI